MGHHNSKASRKANPKPGCPKPASLRSKPDASWPDLQTTMLPPPYQPTSQTSNITSTISKKQPPSPPLTSHPIFAPSRSPRPTSPLTWGLSESRPEIPARSPLRKADRDPEQAITALSTPTSAWTNEQCRLWLALVLRTYSGKTVAQATELAEGFEGWGPNLYMKTLPEWETWLGEDGRGVFGILEERMGLGNGARRVRDGRRMRVEVMEDGGEDEVVVKRRVVGRQRREEIKREVEREWADQRMEEVRARKASERTGSFLT